jgi:hypothetical protein
MERSIIMQVTMEDGPLVAMLLAPRRARSILARLRIRRSLGT